MPNITWDTGDVYGFVMLTVKSYIDNTKKKYIRYVEYICKCKRIGWTRFESLRNGKTKSCGCHHKEVITTNNISRHPLNGVWEGIISRCYNKSCKHYKSYGGRGVIVCEEWKNDIKAFFEWAINNGWQKGLELDKDKLSPNKLGNIYSPEFCCFITHKENMRYRSNSIIIEYKGVKNNLSEWCKELGLEYSRIRQRIFRDKWTIEKSFETKYKRV
jgi:hypothetical protein